MPDLARGKADRNLVSDGWDVDHHPCDRTGPMGYRIRTKPRVILAVVSGGHFLSHFYKLALPPVFPMLSTDFGLSNAEFGLLMSVLVIGGLLQAPVGNVVDRIGAKWVFVAGVALTAAGIGLIGLESTYPSLILLAVVSGLGQSAFHPADYALIDTVTDPGLRGRAFSIHTFCGYAGYAAATVVVGTLAVAMGWRFALFVVGGVGIAYAAFAAASLTPAYRKVLDGEDGVTPTDADSSQSTLTVVLRRSYVDLRKDPITRHSTAVSTDPPARVSDRTIPKV